MDNYIGEFDLDKNDQQFANYTPTNWVMEFIFMYSQI